MLAASGVILKIIFSKDELADLRDPSKYATNDSLRCHLTTC